MTSELRPVDLAISRSQATCTIRWADGSETILPLTELRRMCPCATCNDLRQQTNPLTVLSGPEPSAEISGVEAVGSYAVRFRWADGHDTGIYSYAYLRGLGDPSAAPGPAER